MVVNRNYIEHSEGAKQLLEFCENTADELNIELTKEPYWVLAAKDETTLGDYCKLIIEATTGSVMISLSREEIENYSENFDSNNIEAKIKNEFKTLVC